MATYFLEFVKFVRSPLLDDVTAQQMETTKATFAIPAEKSKTRRGTAGIKTSTVSGIVDAKADLFSKSKKKALTPKQKKKEALFNRRLKHNKNYGIIAEITLLWEKMRLRTISEKQRQDWVALAMTRVKGRIPQLVQHPKASRVLQCCLRYGSVEDRTIVLNEIHSNMTVLSMSKYGKHLVQRLIDKTPRDDFDRLFALFPTHCCRLLKHQYGSDVMNDLYCKADEFQRHQLTLACYGKEFLAALDVDWRNAYRSQKRAGVDPSSLETLFVEDPGRKAIVLQRLHGLLSVLIEKGLLVNRLVHRLITTFLRSAPAAQVEDLCISVAETGDGLMKMVHTNEGAWVASAVLYYVDAKRRKQTLRVFKDYVLETAMDEWGHVALISACRVCDDTRLLRSTLLTSLIDRLEEVCRHRYARRVVLDVLHPECEWYLPPKVRHHLHPRPLEISKGAEKRTIGGGKKDSIVRRRELMNDGEPSLGSALIRLCSNKTLDLLTCRRGCDVLAEVAGGGDGLLDAQGVQTVHQSIINACKENVSLLAHRTVKGVVMHIVRETNGDGKRSSAKRFCKQLWKAVFEGECQRFMDSIVLAALASCGSKSVRAAVRSEVDVFLKDRSIDDWLNAFEENKHQRQIRFRKRQRSKEAS